MTKTPILTSFPRTVFATSRRRLQADLRKARECLLKNSLCGYSTLFEHILPSSWLGSIDPTLRQRTYGHVPVLWAWVAQVLEGNASCSKAAGLVQFWYRESGLPAPSGCSSSYCEARGRVEEKFLKQVAERTRLELARRVGDARLWKGFTLKAIDGTSVQLMDTELNQKSYPQPSSQSPGCGFPVMGIGAMVNLSHGGWEGFATAPYTAHDTKVANDLIHLVGEGDLLLADRAYCSYELISLAMSRGADVLMRLHQARHRALDWRQGERINDHERIVVWKKPVQSPASTMSADAWKQLPDSLTIRLIKMDFEDRYKRKSELVVVTTLIDPERYCGIELSELYAKRWEIEVRIRDVKTTLGMEMFQVRTPDLAHRTLWVVMIAYNLMQALMLEASPEADEPIGFRAVVDLTITNQDSFRPLSNKPRLRAKKREWLMEVIARKCLHRRLGRSEPRAKKRRPKPFALLTKIRHEYFEIPHRSAHRALA